MKIEHIAIWTANLEEMKDFYVKYFNGISNEKYVNSKTGFESYFISFGEGARLEIMLTPSLHYEERSIAMPMAGFAHLAFSVGSREAVDSLTEKLREKGFKVVSGPRQTGDGYYESCVHDPDGNPVEITA